MSHPVESWHRLIREKDPSGLDELLDVNLPPMCDLGPDLFEAGLDVAATRSDSQRTGR